MAQHEEAYVKYSSGRFLFPPSCHPNGDFFKLMLYIRNTTFEHPARARFLRPFFIRVILLKSEIKEKKIIRKRKNKDANAKKHTLKRKNSQEF